MADPVALDYVANSQRNALKIAQRKIATKPTARTARDTRKQRNMCKSVTVRRIAPVTGTVDVRARELSGNYRAAVIVRGNKVF